MEWLGDLILDAMQALWRWVVDTANTMVEGIINGFLDDIPALEGTSIEPFYNILQICNQWVPIDMAIIYIGTYWGFVIAFFVFKMVLKIIPTVG